VATTRTWTIKRSGGGFQVFARTEGDFGSGDGLACMDVFATQEKAQQWTEAQFGIARGDWRSASGALVAAKR
jgi:hypothetical protein